MIQIRNVPDEIHRTFKARAAKAGMSLSDYLMSELRPIAERPTMAEWLEMVRHHPPVHLTVDPVDILREGREERERELG